MLKKISISVIINYALRIAHYFGGFMDYSKILSTEFGASELHVKNIIDLLDEGNTIQFGQTPGGDNEFN